MRIKGFESLRTFAVFMVIAGHVGALANTAGGIGNKIFITLAGFLAYFSVVNIHSLRDVGKYYRNRIMRIVPSFWIVLLVMWRMIPGLFSVRDFSTEHSLVLNMVFLKNWGHLWFLQHIMLMYLCAPLFILLVKMIEIFFARLFGERKPFVPWICAGAIVLLAFAEKIFLTAKVLRLSGEGSHAQFQIWMFLFGFATAVICGNMNRKDRKMKAQANDIAGAFVLFIFLVLFLSVVPSVRTYLPAVTGFLDGEITRTLLVCVVIFLLVMFQGSKAVDMLSVQLFRFFSDLSFEIYLIHFFFLGDFHMGNGLHDFFSNLLISTALAFMLKKGLRRRRNPCMLR